MRYLVLLLFFLPACSIGQSVQSIVTKKTVSGKAKSLFERGNKYLVNGVTDKAISDFDKVIKISPNFIDAYMKRGSGKYDLRDYKAAEIDFEKVIALNADYQPKALYLLAISEKNQRKFEEAISHFEQYISSAAKATKIKAKAKKHIEQSRFLEYAFKNPVPFEPKTLGTNINSTTHAEYFPALTACLLYTSPSPRD